MGRRLIIEKFGKIKKAELEISPLTLLVGDNNSGKSYLLSLLWGIYTADGESVLFQGMEELLRTDYSQVYEKLRDFILSLKQNSEKETQITSQIVVEILNHLLRQNKDQFVAGIFNSKQVIIERLEIAADHEFKLSIKGQSMGERIYFQYCPSGGLSFSAEMLEYDYELVLKMLMVNIFLWYFKGNKYYGNYNTVYLPAARTGFLLAKNVINQVGRQIAYDVSGLSERGEIQPFTKPIIRFLDKLENLSLDRKTEYDDIVSWMEESMVHGKIQYGSKISESDIRYMPNSGGNSLPLRAYSAVVTEVAPLLLLLKYGRKLSAICYEEPEMCLHPKLQQEMGRLLIRLVSHGICMIATTHSDIIVQHINNMCQIKEMGCPEELMKKLSLSAEDVIGIQDIAIYQFQDRGDDSVVEKLTPENGEFRVKTFSNALMELLTQTTEVQDFELG